MAVTRTVHVLPGWGHFDIINHYADPESPIFAAALAATRGRYDRSTGARALERANVA